METVSYHDSMLVISFALITANQQLHDLANMYKQNFTHILYCTVLLILLSCRHPDPNSRPLFTELLYSLLAPMEQLLLTKGPEDVININPKATQLGNSLKHSKNLYTDLQNTYKRMQ